jgi:hypothetical protein
MSQFLLDVNTCPAIKHCAISMPVFNTLAVLCVPLLKGDEFSTAQDASQAPIKLHCIILIFFPV